MDEIEMETTESVDCDEKESSKREYYSPEEVSYDDTCEKRNDDELKIKISKIVNRDDSYTRSFNIIKHDSNNPLSLNQIKEYKESIYDLSNVDNFLRIELKARKPFIQKIYSGNINILDNVSSYDKGCTDINEPLLKLTYLYKFGGITPFNELKKEIFELVTMIDFYYRDHFNKNFFKRYDFIKNLIEDELNKNKKRFFNIDNDKIYIELVDLNGGICFDGSKRIEYKDRHNKEVVCDFIKNIAMTYIMAFHELSD